ncbi:hypothetical protein PENTCL1PPCAC_27677, partial [Pristionchus entomophagus]
AVSNGVSYKVMEDVLKIEVRSLTGEATIRTATCNGEIKPKPGMLSNGVVWKSEAFFFSSGILCALNLDDLSWRCLSQYPTNHLWEISNSDDVLLLTDESKGTLLFSRFRPSFDECKFVINYR